MTPETEKRIQEIRENAISMPPNKEMLPIYAERLFLLDTIATLEADRRRVDWLETNRPNLLCICTFKGSSTVHDGLELEPDGFVWTIDPEHGFEHKTAREAIDAEMQLCKFAKLNNAALSEGGER